MASKTLKDTSKPVSARVEKRIKWWAEKKLKDEEFQKNINDNTYYNNNNINDKKNQQINKNLDKSGLKKDKNEIESVITTEWDISDTETENIQAEIKTDETDTKPTENIKNKKNKQKCENKGDEDETSITQTQTKATKKNKVNKSNDHENSIKSPEDTNPNSASKSNKKKKKLQYVLFVGKLAREATKDHVTKHFEKCGEVKDVRMLTKKGTEESKRCAYVEFLDKFSHLAGLRLNNSMMLGNKINVEFTSVGRKTFHRMERLKQKNQMSAARFRGVGDYRKKKPEGG